MGLIWTGALIHVSAGRAAPALEKETQLVYFGTYTGEKSRGIYLAELEPSTGMLSEPQLAGESRNPTFLAADPERQALYAVNEVTDFGQGNSGAVSAFKVDPKTGRLTLLNQQPSGGSGPCHLAVARNGKCVLVANYGSGSVAALPVGNDGQLGKPTSIIQHHGSSVNPHRQEGPHAHFITWDPTDRLVLACDLGLDKVLLYKLSSQLELSPAEPPFFALQPGSGPRHLAFGADGRFVYIINEISSTLTACAYDSVHGELKEVQTLSTLPRQFKGANTCAEVEVHPNGKFLYASNRGHDTIAVFSIDPANGKLGFVQHASTEGKTPRHFALAPGGRWLLAENQDSDSVVVFSVAPETGLLRPSGLRRTVGAPVCAVFLAKQ